MSLNRLINRDQELEIIDGALDTLLDTSRLLRTPIIEFYGVEGIGKTALLEEVSQRCKRKHLTPIWLDKDSIGDIDANFIQPTQKLLEKEKKGVVIVDALDDFQDEQLRAFENGLQDLIENRFLFVVLASKSEKKFDTYRSVARKLTSFHLQPLRQADCQKYFNKFQGLKPEFRDVIYEWTRGYPFAMDVMANAIIGTPPGQSLDPSNIEDRRVLLSILKEQVINQKLLAKASSNDHPRLEVLLTLLSVPRRFNLAVMQDIVEEFAPIYKKNNALEYIALPHEIHIITPILDWSLSRAGYCIDDSVRNVFLLQLKLVGLTVAKGQVYTYQDIHRFMAIMNETLANEVLGPDHIRYLKEWFYHLLESGETTSSVLQKMTVTIERLAEDRSVELLIQFHEEFKQDQHLNHALGSSAQGIILLMSEHLERLKVQTQDTNVGLASFSEQFKQALRLSQRAFARSLLQEAKKFDEEPLLSRERLQQISSEQHQDLKLAEARLLLSEEKPLAALLIYDELERESSWVQSHTSDLLFGKGDCYFHADRYVEAMRSFELCLQLEQENDDKTRTAEVYNALGLIARRQARFREARDYFLNSLDLFKSLALSRRYASVLNNLGNVYRLLGEPKTGLLYCRRGLLMNERLYDEGQIGPVPVGLSHMTLGHMYHTLERLAEEELHYQKAFEIFDVLGFRYHRSSAYVALGKVCVAKNDLDQAFAYFTKVYELAQGVNREAEIEGLNQLGRVLRQREQWSAAAEKFTQAIELSRIVGRPFPLAENLTYLADVLDQMGLPVQRQMEEARKIAHNELMQGRIEETQGDIYYRHGQYQAAFERYAEACKFVAQYGQLDFTKLLRKLEDRLLDTPDELLPATLTVLMTYWSDNHLDDEYPDFSAVCRLVQRL